MTYTHTFDASLTPVLRLKTSNLVVFFEPTTSSAAVSGDYLSSNHIWAMNHFDSISSDKLICDYQNRQLIIPLTNNINGGAAKYIAYEYVRFLTELQAYSPADISVNSIIPQGIGFTNAVYGATVKTSSGKRARLINLGSNDKKSTQHDFTVGASVV
jgi:hypothetical protein